MLATAYATSAMASRKKPWLAEENAGKFQLWKASFIVENGFGAMEAVAGGNFMIFAKDQPSGLVSR